MSLIAHKGQVIANGFMTQYPGGEPAWKPGRIIPDGSVVGLQWHGDMNELVGFCSWMAGDYGPSGVTVVMPFLPCSRQDKLAPEDGDQSEGAAYILRTVLSSPKIDRLILVDNHSNPPLDYLGEKTIFNLPSVGFVRKEDFQGVDLVVGPDKGAIGRAAEFAKFLDVPYCHADKVRDQASGRILSLELPVGLEPAPESVLVVDDILDGGYTYELVADAIEKRWPRAKKHLFVTHSVLGNLKSKGIPPCIRRFDHVTTTDSCQNAQICQSLVELNLLPGRFRVLQVLEKLTVDRSLHV